MVRGHEVFPPSNRISPRPGQESVWDYPRPPRLEVETRSVRVVLAGVPIAETARPLRVLETSHPPVYYVPASDILPGVLTENADRSWCEWKGEASYLDVTIGTRREVGAAWRYGHPAKPYAALAGFVAFYAQRMDACFVGEEQVTAQPGEFYGGWVTSWVVGPFKGVLGSRAW